MLLKLTNKCYEGCSHCMECSGPDGEHMSLETLKDAVEFLRYTGVRGVAISGGEFTTDPQFYDKIMFVVNRLGRDAVISLQSNGSFIEDKEKVDQLKDILKHRNVVGLQISSNKKFYPNYEWTMSHAKDFEAMSSKVVFVTDWQNLHRLGRAQNLKDVEFKRSPACSPIVSRGNQMDKVLRKGANLTDFIHFLEISGYVCKPMINENGSVHIGECQFCTKLGDINGYSHMMYKMKDEVNEGILDKIRNSVMCDRCGEVINLKGKVPNYTLVTKSFK